MNCRGRPMRIVSETELVKLGYTNNWNLKSSFYAWEQAGVSIEGR